MLGALSIRDVVLIDRLDLTFEPGLTVLTGETGAGKSILLDALGLALGARAESGLVRRGAERATVVAAFGIDDGHPVRALLAEQGLEAEGELLLRRQLGADGRSRAFVNDQPVSIGLLRQIGELLVEIEGQFEQRGLLDTANHRRLLDAFAGLGEATAAAADAWRGWQAARRARLEAESAVAAARRDEAFLRHALSELEALQPQPGEEQALAEMRALLLNAGRIVEALEAAAVELAGERGAESRLAAAQKRLLRVGETAGPQVQAALAALDRAAAETEEALAQLRAAAGSLTGDPRRLERTEERLFALREQARKHGVAVDALAELRERFAARLAALAEGGDSLGRLARAEAEARARYAERAEALSTARAAAAGRLEQAVGRELPALKLEKALFRVAVEPLPEAEWGESGRDAVAFLVSTIPGVPPAPIARVASGGELSRLMLALRVALAASGPVPTLVFDEVDAGVGGATAAAVGDRLARLAAGLQVLVVTHSPQVAARGAQHWRVTKSAGKRGFLTRAERLAPAERREEIARMLAGAVVTPEARAAADRLLAGPPARAAS